MTGLFVDSGEPDLSIDLWGASCAPQTLDLILQLPAEYAPGGTRAD